MIVSGNRNDPPQMKELPKSCDYDMRNKIYRR